MDENVLSLGEIQTGIESNTSDKIVDSATSRADRIKSLASLPEYGEPDIVGISDALRTSTFQVADPEKFIRSLGISSGVGEQIVAVLENFVADLGAFGDKTALAFGNTANWASDGTVGKDLQDAAFKSMQARYADMQDTIESVGGITSELANFAGGAASFMELALVGLATYGVGALAQIGVESQAEGVYADMEKWAEEHDGDISGYKPETFDLAVNTANTLLQIVAERKLGFGSPRFLHGASRGLVKEGVGGALQEAVQSALSDFKEVIKGNEEFEIMFEHGIDYMRDAIIGGILQGAVGAATYHTGRNKAINKFANIYARANGRNVPNKKDQESAKKTYDALEAGQVAAFTQEFKNRIDAQSGAGKLQQRLVAEITKQTKQGDGETVDLNIDDETERAQRIEQIATVETINALMDAEEKNISIDDHELNTIEFKDGKLWLAGRETTDFGVQTVSEDALLQRRAEQATPEYRAKKSIKEEKARNAEAIDAQRKRTQEARLARATAQAETAELRAKTAEIKKETAKAKKEKAEQKLEQAKTQKPKKLRTIVSVAKEMRVIENAKRAGQQEFDFTQLPQATQEVVKQPKVLNEKVQNIITKLKNKQNELREKYKYLKSLSLEGATKQQKKEVEQFRKKDDIDSVYVLTAEYQNYPQTTNYIVLEKNGELYTTNELNTKRNPLEIETLEKVINQSGATNVDLKETNAKEFVDNATKMLDQHYSSQGSTSGKGDTKRGAYNNTLKYIVLTSSSDLSTLQHEFAHYWMNNNFKWARSGQASAEWLKRWRAVENALGILESDDVLMTEASEKFARAYERWIMQGEQNESLSWAFAGLQKAYQEIYEDLEAEYFDWKEELDPAIVEWFDRQMPQTAEYAIKTGLQQAAELAEQTGADIVTVDKDADMVTVAKAGGETDVYVPTEQGDKTSRLAVFDDKTASGLEKSLNKKLGTKTAPQKLAKLNKADSVENAMNWIRTDRQGAWDALTNPNTADLDRSILYNAFVQEAENDPQLMLDLVAFNKSGFSQKARKMGQAIAMLDTNNNSGFDMVEIIANLEKAKGQPTAEQTQSEIDNSGVFDVELTDADEQSLLEETECSL